MPPSVALLSCQLCQAKKTKCDKGDPCSACQRAGVKCEAVTRQRLPRGRKGGRKKVDADIKARLGRLESLVGSFGILVSPDQSAEPAKAEPIPKSGDMSRYLGSSFWSSLSSEVGGLREALDQSSDDESDMSPSSQLSETTSEINARSFSFLLCPPNNLLIAPNVLQHPPPQMVFALCEIYFQNVDPLIKVLHAPSVRTYLEGRGGYLDYQPGDPAVEALSNAIYYSAIITLNDATCQREFSLKKDELLTKFRFALEISLARADLVNTRDITVLAAFVIFLVSIIQPYRIVGMFPLDWMANESNFVQAAARTADHSRWTWTLTALAVRIGNAMSLHMDCPTTSQTLFERELRHRLWSQVMILDIQTALDRGSDPIITDEPSSLARPLRINDVDIDPKSDSVEPLREREGFTDMTLSSMNHVGTIALKRLIRVARNEITEEDMEENRIYVVEFQQNMHQHYLRHCNVLLPLPLFTKIVGELEIAMILLTVVRPMHRHTRIALPSVKSANILSLAITIMEYESKLGTDPQLEHWKWYTWVQWHALAVAIAELCILSEGDLVDRAWRVVDAAFKNYGEIVADSKQGMLWRPMTKLMRKAQQHRARTLSTSAANSSAKMTMDQPASQPLHQLQRQSVNADPPNPFHELEGHEQLPEFGMSLNETWPSSDQWDLDPFLLASNDLSEPSWELDSAWMNWGTFLDDVTDVDLTLEAARN